MKHFLPKFLEIPGISEMDLHIIKACDWSLIFLENCKQMGNIHQIGKCVSNNIDEL